MVDEMFFTHDNQSLRRGKRRAARTVTCRPCLVWTLDNPKGKVQGVVMNVTPHGMLIRMIDMLPIRSGVEVQLMRDDEFREPLAKPVRGVVVRVSEAAGGFRDHGIELVQEEIKRVESRAPVVIKRKPIRRYTPRMHTIDIRVGNRERRKGPGR